MSRCRALRRAAACSSGRPDEGFTLVEVMVALGIFLVVSAATLGLIMKSLETIRGNADRVYAAALARSEVEDLRTLGSAAIPLGASSRSVQTDAGDFLITRTATWVDIGAPTNPCDVGAGVTPGKSYLRVQVEVEGGELEAPQTVQAVVYPNDSAPTENTGTITVEVDDDLGQPVSGVTVSGSNGSTQTFQQVTGPDGCIFAPDLAAGPNWAITISKPGYITEQLTDEATNGVVVNELQNTPLTFGYAASGTVTFTAGTGGYPVPAAMPFTFSPDTRNRMPTTFGGYPVTVTGLWPDDYTGWLRPCTGAGDGSTASTTLAQGGTASMDLGGTRVQFVGPVGGTLKATYAGACTATYTLGTWDATLLLKATLPDGEWTFTVTGAPGVDKERVLTSAVGLCSVSWNVANSVTQEEADTLREDPTFIEPVGGLLIRPEVSDPCP